MKKPFNFKPNVLVLAMMAAASTTAMAVDETLAPGTTQAADATAVTVPQNSIQYQVNNSLGGSVGPFTYNATSGLWSGPSGWSNLLAPNGTVIPGIVGINVTLPTEQTVEFPTPPTYPQLNASGAPYTTSLEPTSNNSVAFTSSVVGPATSTFNLNITAPGTQNVTAVPNPINYDYASNANSSLNVGNGAAPYSGAISFNASGSPVATGNVVVQSNTTAYQTGNYTVAFNNSSTGNLTGGSVALSGNGLFFNSLSGTASLVTDANGTTGAVLANVTATPTTSITSAGIVTNNLNVTGNAVVGGNLAVTGDVAARDVNVARDLRVSAMTYTNGINNGGQQITNVAPGTDGMDAVNLNQLNSVESRLQKQIDDTDKNAKKGIATVAAMANIPQVDETKTFSLGAGVGGYDSEWGFAVGGSYRVAPAVILKGSIGTSDGGDVAGGLGISSSW
jgi:trimeric autotransporter adhesin